MKIKIFYKNIFILLLTIIAIILWYYNNEAIILYAEGSPITLKGSISETEESKKMMICAQEIINENSKNIHKDIFQRYLLNQFKDIKEFQFIFENPIIIENKSLLDNNFDSQEVFSYYNYYESFFLLKKTIIDRFSFISETLNNYFFNSENKKNLTLTEEDLIVFKEIKETICKIDYEKEKYLYNEYHKYYKNSLKKNLQVFFNEFLNNHIKVKNNNSLQIKNYSNNSILKVKSLLRKYYLTEILSNSTESLNYLKENYKGFFSFQQMIKAKEISVLGNFQNFSIFFIESSYVNPKFTDNCFRSVVSFFMKTNSNNYIMENSLMNQTDNYIILKNYLNLNVYADWMFTRKNTVFCKEMKASDCSFCFSTLKNSLSQDSLEGPINLKLCSDYYDKYFLPIFSDKNESAKILVKSIEEGFDTIENSIIKPLQDQVEKQKLDLKQKCIDLFIKNYSNLKTEDSKQAIFSALFDYHKNVNDLNISQKTLSALKKTYYLTKSDANHNNVHPIKPFDIYKVELEEQNILLNKIKKKLVKLNYLSDVKDIGEIYNFLYKESDDINFKKMTSISSLLDNLEKLNDSLISKKKTLISAFKIKFREYFK